MKNLLLYPVDIESLPILRHENLLREYKITSLIAPKGWGYNGLDAGCIDGGSTLGINVSTNFDDAIDSCDTVLFIPSQNELNFEEYIYPKIEKSISNSKEIIIANTLSNEQNEKLKNVCKDKSINYQYIAGNNHFLNTEVINEELEDINTPVIFVLGTGNKTHKFELQLGIRECFQSEGYKVSQIGSRSYCELLGFHSMPQFMYSKSINEASKVILFNKYIKFLENSENPDVIIVGIPGNIMPMSKDIPDDFGILAYLISNSVTPDVAICSVLFEQYKSAFFDNISISLKYKFGYEVDFFNLANIQLDWLAKKYHNSKEYITLESSFVDKQLNELNDLSNRHIYNILNNSDVNNLYRDVLNKLLKYGEVDHF